MRITAKEYRKLTKRRTRSKYGNKKVKIDGLTFDYSMRPSKESGEFQETRGRILMSGRKSKQKGNRREREFAKLIEGRRIPLSGAQEGFENDVQGLGLKWEVKARKDGFKTLYQWLEDEREKPDALALKADRKPWLVVMELDTFLKLLGGNEDAGQDHRREAGVAEEGR